MLVLLYIYICLSGMEKFYPTVTTSATSFDIFAHIGTVRRGLTLRPCDLSFTDTYARPALDSPQGGHGLGRSIEYAFRFWGLFASILYIGLKHIGNKALRYECTFGSFKMFGIPESE